MSLNEIDTMTLIMPSGPGRPRAAALDAAAAGGAAAGGGGGGKVRLYVLKPNFYRYKSMVCTCNFFIIILLKKKLHNKTLTWKKVAFLYLLIFSKELVANLILF